MFSKLKQRMTNIMATEKTMKDFVKEAKSQIEEIQIMEVNELIAEGYQVLDVREPAEYADGTIQGAMNVPRGILESGADRKIKGNDALQDRNKKWLLLCKSSGRSAMATVALQQMGFKNVKNINGGFNAWKDAKLDIVKPS